MNHGALPPEVSGVRLRLRFVRIEDADYVYRLRVDPSVNLHLSEVSGTVEDQSLWIETYKFREAAGAEGYYVIERLSGGKRCGLVRLYDIQENNFTWGSWILDANKPPKGALESAVLSFGIGFGQLGKSFANVEVRRANTHATAFYRRLNMIQVGADAQNLYFRYTRERFEADRPLYLKVLHDPALSARQAIDGASNL